MCPSKHLVQAPALRHAPPSAQLAMGESKPLCSEDGLAVRERSALKTAMPCLVGCHKISAVLHEQLGDFQMALICGPEQRHLTPLQSERRGRGLSSCARGTRARQRGSAGCGCNVLAQGRASAALQ